MNPHQKPQEDVVEPSWTGNPHGLANELRRVANVWNGEYRMTQLLRDAADEIDTLTTAPTYEAGRRDMREAAGKVADEYAAGCLKVLREDEFRGEALAYARGCLTGAQSVGIRLRALPTEPLGGEG